MTDRRPPAEQTDETQPVTVIARHWVLDGKEAEFDKWLDGIVEACSHYAGYLGSEVVHAPRGQENERACVFRFDTLEHLQRWFDSDERQQWLRRAEAFYSRPPQILHYQSIEFLFPSGSKPPPPRYKMALLTLLALLPLVHFIPRLVARHVSWPPLVLTLVTTAGIVVLMTWAVMPLVTRLTARWLWHKRKR